MTTDTKIHALALEAQDSLERFTVQETGTATCRWKGTAPEWMRDMSKHAHGGMWPDNWRFQFIQAALDRIVEYDNMDDARDEIEGDPFTHSLIDWLGSSYGRIRLVNDVLEETDTKDIDTALRIAQCNERAEVFDLVLEFLTEKANG